MSESDSDPTGSPRGFAGAPQEPPAVEASPWGRRLGAWLIDSLLVGLPFGWLIISRMMNEFEASRDQLVDPATGELDQAAVEQLFVATTEALGPVGLLSAVAFTLYLVVLHGTIGQTLGKKALGIRVIKDDGSPCDLLAAAKRALVFPVAASFPYIGLLVFLVNGLWPLWDQKRQSLGDKVGATYVVLSKSSPG